MKTSLILIFLCVFAVLQSCSDNNKTSNDFSSPKMLFVDYISSYTGGIVSVSSPVVVKLAKAIPDSFTQNIKVTGLFEFSPSISGRAFWEDERTIVFQPDKLLEGDKKYQVVLNLKPLVPQISNDKEQFKFEFKTYKQNFDIQIGGLQYYNKTDIKKAMVTCELQTADYAPYEQIKKMVKASQNGKALELTWKKPEKSNRYNFTIENISRSNEQEKVEFTVDGSLIYVDKKENLEIPVPPLSEYKVLSASVFNGDETYISVVFSEPLDDKQNLSGLVKLSNLRSIPRLVINVNELKIYLTEEVRGTQTITLLTGIKNVAGFPLKEDYSAILTFYQVKPKVSFLDQDNKAILPNSNGLLLPFKAVGLKAVEVTVTKIFANNILQYLQTNKIGGRYELRRVGRAITKKTVLLNTHGVTDLNKENVFTLNLDKIFQSEPGAIYQIEIDFSRKHSAYVCEDDPQAGNIDTEIENDETEMASEDYYDEYENEYYDDYEYGYYNYQYDWKERDNPCSEAYYIFNQPIKKILFASDLGLIAKGSDNGSLDVFVTNLINTQPVPDANIEVFDYQQQLLSEGKTDGEGKFSFNLIRKPFALVVSKDKQKGYLKLDDGSSLSLSSFDVSGGKVQRGLKGFIYGERGVWRPADTLHMAFILENATNNIPEKHPVIMELYNPQNQIEDRKISFEPVGNIYRFDFVTRSDAPTGNWLIKTKVGGATFSKTVKIETIKPNRLKINLDFGKEKLTASDKFAYGNLSVRWLSGATAKNLKAEYEMLISPVKTTFDGFSNFTFDDKAKDFNSKREMIFEGRIDSSGKSKITINLEKMTNAPGALNVKLFGKVYEEGGDFSLNNFSIPYYPYSSYVGINVPKEGRKNLLEIDKNHVVRVATLSSDGKPLSRNQVKIQLFHMDWRWWWDNSYNNVSNYISNMYRRPQMEKIISTKNGAGEWTFKSPEGGRYYIRVTDMESGHSAGEIVYFSWRSNSKEQLLFASMLDFGVEKNEYNVGEKINLSIPSTKGNKILVSLETGSKVLQTFWVDARESSTAVTFEATNDMCPNVYVHLTMIQPHNQVLNDLPIRLYGIQSIKVVDPGTILNPVISMPAELRPEQKFSVTITEKNKKAMAYTIAIVDEGLLDITNFKTPEPWLSFYTREALGIKTWDIYSDVINAYTGQLENMLSIGGDDQLQPRDQTEANRFKPVVKYLGPFFLNSGEKQTHQIKMPQYIGSIKTAVVASVNGAYGNTEQVTPVKQPLMVLATLPRVTGPGESMMLPVNIFVLDNTIKNVTIDVNTEGPLEVEGEKSRTISFNAKGDQLAFFKLKAKNSLGIGRVKVSAKSGNVIANYDIELNILPRNPLISDIEDKVVGASESWEFDYQPLGISGKNEAKIELSTMPPLNIEKRLKYLIRYPHGCAEQTTSAAFAQLFLNNLAVLSLAENQDIQFNVEAAIQKLKGFQVSNGGFAYWPGQDEPGFWSTNYVGHFLAEAKNIGYDVPEGMLANWVKYQTSNAENWISGNSYENSDDIQAYRLYTLARAGHASLSSMNRMKENIKTSLSAKWRLALAFLEAGYKEQALKLIENIPVRDEKNVKEYRYTYGSPIRDLAMVLETLTGLGQKEKAFEIVLEIAREMGEKNHWMSTQTTAYCFVALSKYAKEFPIGKETKVKLLISGKAKNIYSAEFINVEKIADADKKGKIKITNENSEPVYARLIRSGIPLENTEIETERNITFNVQYLSNDGLPLDVSRLKQGTNFTAQVTVSHPGIKNGYSDLALTQLFPSGWEIINRRLEESPENEKVWYNYMDIRDDRVMHYFDLNKGTKKTFKVILNAAYQGRYYLPSASVEAMYDNTIYANKKGEWVEVIPGN